MSLRHLAIKYEHFDVKYIVINFYNVYNLRIQYKTPSIFLSGIYVSIPPSLPFKLLNMPNAMRNNAPHQSASRVGYLVFNTNTNATTNANALEFEQFISVLENINSNIIDQITRHNTSEVASNQQAYKQEYIADTQYDFSSNNVITDAINEYNTMKQMNTANIVHSFMYKYGSNIIVLELNHAVMCDNNSRPIIPTKLCIREIVKSSGQHQKYTAKLELL
jgi:hypothetical protein